ncbi:hypothetical protein JL100_010485 [Skermanella mucosa]|uniref:hypothetical protein n=1 Tax=Skermanella mucosa TaxID=1789672 RepID=UPI00192CA3F6|nr:hypothetical protein [Skermanella mucosa]UEM23140.1 hypothetical protein JL100_010485 [Skermanella mucosa]
MEIRNAVLLQGVKSEEGRRDKLSENLDIIKRGSRYRLIGELSLAEVFQHPTLGIALERFGIVDLVLVESYDAIRGQYDLFDDFLDFWIKLAFIDDIMEEIFRIDEQSLTDPYVDDYIHINTEEIASLAAVGKYKLKQALRGFEESRPLSLKSRERDKKIYDAMKDIVCSGEATVLGSISTALQIRGYHARGRNGKPTPFHESQLLRIADSVGKGKEFRKLRQLHSTKRSLTPRRKE